MNAYEWTLAAFAALFVVCVLWLAYEMRRLPR